MKRYLIDSNYCLRFLLRDNDKQYEIVRGHFVAAKQGHEEIVVLPEIIVEVNYVLRSYYKTPHTQSAESLLKFIQLPFLVVIDSGRVLAVLEIYQKINADMEDIILYVHAQQIDAEVLSFDEDIKKLKGLFNKL